MAYPILANGMGSGQSIYAPGSTQFHSLGAMGRLGPKLFRYASYTGAALGVGNLLRRAASAANHVSILYSSGGAIGSTKITVTLAATAATANQYAEGEIIGIDGTGSGQSRRIKSHPAADASATLQITTYDPFETAAAASSEWSLLANPYSAVAQTPGNAAAFVVGVNPAALPAGSTTTQYGWIQTGGPCLVVGDGSTFVLGAQVTLATAGTADAGQVTIQSGTAEAGQQDIGRVIDIGDAASDLDFRYVWLVLD